MTMMKGKDQSFEVPLDSEGGNCPPRACNYWRAVVNWDNREDPVVWDHWKHHRGAEGVRE